MEIHYKDCTKCKKNIPFHGFYQNKKGKYGLCSQCKKCMNKNCEKTTLYKVRKINTDIRWL